MSSPAPRSRTALVLILAAACWGLGTVISKRAVQEFPPVTLLSIQLAASLVVLRMVRLASRPIPPSETPPPAMLRLLGILNPGLAYALGLLGLVHISASLSVMLWALEPLLILILAGLFLQERIGPWIAAWSAVAAAGIVLVVYEPGDGSALGVALTIAGVGCCAVYTVVARRLLPAADSTARVVRSQQAFALAFALALAAGIYLVGGAVWPADTTPAGWLSAIASGVLYYGVAYSLYLAGLRAAPASLAATSFYLIPIFGLASSAVLLGERLQPIQWLGVATALVALLLVLHPIALGSWLATRPVSRRARR